MITKSNAIEIGQAVVAAFNKEMESTRNTDTPTARGVTYTALGNIWYDVISVNTREKFGYNFEAFLSACDWK